MKFNMGRKGLGLQDLSTVGTVLVVTGIVLGIGAYINSQIQTTAGWGTTSVQYLAVSNATDAISKLAQWLPIIAIVFAAGIILGVLALAFMPRGGVGV